MPPAFAAPLSRTLAPARVRTSLPQTRLAPCIAPCRVLRTPRATAAPDGDASQVRRRRAGARADPTPTRLTQPASAASPNRSLANLHELTERIADLLQVGSIEKSPLHCPKDAPLGYLSATTHVVVVFGKHLIRDQVTVEYAKRVVTLVKQIASGGLKPDVICFTGGRGVLDDAGLSEASMGYSFFRNVCEEAHIDVSRFQFILEEKSRNTKENLDNVIEELRRRSGSDAVSACHFTLVSSDYHLIRIQEVHRLSPRQSILFPLEVSAATWNCIFAAYPFCVSQDPATAFLGRAVVLANDLGILLVNLNGAIDDRQFISRENLHRLNETFAKMREMYRVIDSRAQTPGGGFRTDMLSHAETLELAIHDVREVQTLLNPLNEVGVSVPHAHLELARELLRNTIAKMRASMDPDRVLRIHDRMAIIDDMNNYVAEQRLKPRHPLSLSSPQSDPDATPRGRSLRFTPEDDRPPVDRPGISYFDQPNDGNFPGALSSTRRRMSTSSEVTWRDACMFKGNGKKITRDGPHLVITDSSCPPLTPASPPAVKRSRAQRQTVAQSDGNAGRLVGSLAADNVQTATRSARATAARARNTSAQKRKTSATSATKKRKPTTRKLASPSPGDAI